MRRCLSGSRRPSGCGGWQGYPGSPRRPCAGSGPVGFRCKGRRMSHDAPPVQAAWCMRLIGPPMTWRSIQPPRPPACHARRRCPGLGIKRPGPAPWQHHVVDEPDRHAELRRRRTMRAAFLHDINDALTKLHRKWLAHVLPPTSATGRGLRPLQAWHSRTGMAATRFSRDWFECVRHDPWNGWSSARRALAADIIRGPS